MNRIAEAVSQAVLRLAESSDSARADAEILLAQRLGYSRAQLYSLSSDELDGAICTAFLHDIERRQRGEPVAYITGRKGFWTLELKVNPAVLVPRPETELLVEWALSLIPKQMSWRVADLGTGSGCIALAIAAERPQAQVTATDASAAALALAAENARNLRLPLRLLQGSWWQAVGAEHFDLIVSNPPYIAAHDPHLQHLVHEPRQALTDEADGLACLREIINQAPEHLDSGGWLLLEHGFDQGAAVRELFGAAGFSEIETRHDLAGLERVTGGQKT